jgi:hypothetical protein
MGYSANYCWDKLTILSLITLLGAVVAEYRSTPEGLETVATRCRQTRFRRSDPIFPERVPLRADGVEMQGWLLVGPRPDGSPHGKVERAALVEIADLVARALAIARSRQTQNTLLNGVIADLLARIERLERNVRAKPGR